MSDTSTSFLQIEQLRKAYGSREALIRLYVPPMQGIAITEATPSMVPSMVRKLRSLPWRTRKCRGR